MYYVYIIRSEKDGSFYTGMTSDVDRRLQEHNRSDTKTTRSKKPWKVVYSQEFPTRAEARKYEKYLKTGSGREFRKQILEQ